MQLSSLPSYNLITEGGALAYDGDIFDTPNCAGSMNYATGELTITAVPEPSVYALGLVAAAVFAAQFYRRRARR